MSGVVYTQSHRPLALTTPLGDNVLLADQVAVQEGISRLFEIQIQAKCKNGSEVPFDKLLGQPALIRWRQPQKAERLFHGIVSSITQLHTDNEFTHYELELVPTLWLLTQRIQSRVFVRKSAREILRDVLQGIPTEFALASQYPKREFCVQYRETDFAFISRLMEEEGICYFFKHSADDHTLVLADAPSSHPKLTNTVRLKNTGEANITDDEAILALGKTQQLVTGKVHLRDHHFQLPHDTLAVDQQIPAEVLVGSARHSLNVGPVLSLEEYDYPGDYARHFDNVSFNGVDQPDRLRELVEDNQRSAKIRLQSQSVRA
ncbi:MAG: type VI secretion system Vgr family protein, partial [Gemmataceae bacterium]